MYCAFNWQLIEPRIQVDNMAPLDLAGQYWSPYDRKMRVVLPYRQISFNGFYAKL